MSSGFPIRPNGTADFFVMSNIGREEDGVGAQLLQVTFEYLALSHTAAGHGDPSAGFGERQGRGTTNPGQGGGNENDGACHDQTPSRYDVGRMAVRPLAYGNHGHTDDIHVNFRHSRGV